MTMGLTINSDAIPQHITLSVEALALSLASMYASSRAVGPLSETPPLCSLSEAGSSDVLLSDEVSPCVLLTGVFVLPFGFLGAGATLACGLCVGGAPEAGCTFVCLSASSRHS